ncbi:alpha/beta fold hydrolase [Actinocorallia herbida]|nr:alpha/beta hydrolase [Actinocorallia herbida]
MTTEARAWWRDPALGARRELTLPTGTVAVSETGSGEPIVFVHGLLVNANLWRLVVPGLADRFRCLTLDLPFGAHAGSVPDADLTPPGLAALVVAALEALDRGPVTLVGNDTGGAVCQLVAVSRPDLVARLVLTSCDAYDNFPPKAFGYLKPVAAVPGGLAALLTALRLPALRRLPIAFGRLSRRTVPRKVSDTYVLPACVGRDVRADLRRVLRGVDRRHTLEAARRFGGFTRPVLIAWSADDVFFPAGHAERLAADFPDATLTWIPGARTFSAEDAPEALAASIAAFVGDNPVVDNPVVETPAR